VHFSLKICNLVATILVIFHWGNFSKVVCFSHMRNFS